jgi:hypothetical protein
LCAACACVCLPAVQAHELGHSLGMNHASTDSNNDGRVDVEYADLSDPLGPGSTVCAPRPRPLCALRVCPLTCQRTRVVFSRCELITRRCFERRRLPLTCTPLVM